VCSVESREKTMNAELRGFYDAYQCALGDHSPKESLGTCYRLALSRICFHVSTAHFLCATNG
jgi:hypothetical protein